MDAKTMKIIFLALALTLHRYVRCDPTVGRHGHLIARKFSNNLGLFSAPIDIAEEDRIVGGTYAQDGQFPFMAVVHRLLGSGRISQCGGTIISSRWVLTAGHCVANAPRKFFVVFGTIDKSGIGYDSNSGPGLSMITTEGALHPNYKQLTNDIGLLRMPQDIPFSSRIQPVRLPGRNYLRNSFSGRASVVVGWGRDQLVSSGTKALKYARLPTISNQECGNYWRVYANVICTAAGVGEDACQGDSGGPLLVMENGYPMQIGIVSYGDQNCPSNKPGVFTRVTSHMDWIQAVTGISF